MSDDKSNVLDELNGFTATAYYYRLPFVKGFVYTDGVAYLAENAGAYWLIELIAFEILPKVVKKSPDWFYSVKLAVNADSKAILTVDDGNGNKPIVTREIDYADFPQVNDFKLFLEKTSVSDGEAYCLLLPSEH